MNLKAQYEKCGFWTMNYSENLAKLVEVMMRTWKNFCSLPLEIKSLFVYENGVGYEQKDGINTGDKKENLHLTIKGLERILEIARKEKVDPNLFNQTKLLLDEIINPLTEFARGIEQFDLPNFSDKLRKGYDEWTLRFLFYPPGAQPGEIIAHHHVDKLDLTVYLKETTPGVQYYDKDNQWKNVPILPGQMIITPGLRGQYLSHCKIEGLYHQVKANQKSEKDGRYAIVCFLDSLDGGKYNKHKFGRTQDLPLGFNRKMSYQELEKFFI